MSWLEECKMYLEMTNNFIENKYDEFKTNLTDFGNNWFNELEMCFGMANNFIESTCDDFKMKTGLMSDEERKEDLINKKNQNENEEKQDYIDSIKNILSANPEELATEELIALQEQLKEQFEIEGEATEEDIKEIEKFLEENYESLIPEEFLVREAVLYCNCGTHERKLNILKDHAVYTEKKPMIHELDKVKDENITFFGVCNSGSKLLKSKSVLLKIERREEVKNADGTTSIVTKEENVRGKKCEPYIIGNWEDTKEDVRIVDNGDKDPFDKFKSRKSSDKGYRAVTTKSFLVCKYGGIIEPLTSGQDIIEENTSSESDENLENS